jgi:hypothetical protein
MNVTALIEENGATSRDHAVVTLQRLRVLEQLYEQGYQDDIIDMTVQKLLEHQVQKDESQLHQLKTELTKYQQQFGMTSEVFAEKYQAGQMGDDSDVFEWHVLYKMYTRLCEQLKILKAQLGEKQG